MAKELKPTETSIVPVTAEDYPIALMDASDLREAIHVNLNGETLAFKDLRRVKVPSGGATSWSIPAVDGGKPTPTNDFQGVIIHSELGRVMWLNDLGKGGGNKGPDCSGAPDNEGAWHGSKSRQWIAAAAKSGKPPEMASEAGPRQDCAGCPFSEFGSGRNGKGQKCQQKRVFYIATDDSLLPLVLIAPVMSLQNAKKYLTSLAFTPVKSADGKQRMFAYHEVITNFSLEGDSNGENDFAKIAFSRVAVLPDDQRAAFAAYRATMKPLVSNLTGAALAQQEAQAKAGDDFGDLPGEQSIEYVDADEDETMPSEDD